MFLNILIKVLIFVLIFFISLIIFTFLSRILVPKEEKSKLGNKVQLATVSILAFCIASSTLLATIPMNFSYKPTQEITKQGKVKLVVLNDNFITSNGSAYVVKTDKGKIVMLDGRASKDFYDAKVKNQRVEATYQVETKRANTLVNQTSVLVVKLSNIKKYKPIHKASKIEEGSYTKDMVSLTK